MKSRFLICKCGLPHTPPPPPGATVRSPRAGRPAKPRGAPAACPGPGARRRAAAAAVQRYHYRYRSAAAEVSKLREADV